MSRFVQIGVAVAALAVSVTAASAQIYPLTNGPNGAGSNVVDSERGFDGINAVAPEREFIEHPERAGNVGGRVGFAVPRGDYREDDAALAIAHHARHRHRHRAAR